MIQLPPGFDIALLLADFSALAVPVVACSALITGYYIYKRVVNNV